MKHTPRITAILVLLFFLSQIIGLYAIEKSSETTLTVDKQTGETRTVVSASKNPFFEPPPRPEDTTGFIVQAVFIFLAILIGTAIGLLLARFKRFNIWRLWFSLAVFVSLSMSFYFLFGRKFALSLIAAAILSYLKVFRSNFYVHNFTELFIYAGIATMLVPWLDVLAASILLILIALYDAYAVWKSKHMIALAKFQMQGAFAGLSLHYDAAKDKVLNLKKTKLAIPRPKTLAQTTTVKNAILGGGDIAFPLLFAGTVFWELLEKDASNPFLRTMLISASATLALAFLFKVAKKDKFYPAMPFIAAGCFVGYGLILLL